VEKDNEIQKLRSTRLPEKEVIIEVPDKAREMDLSNTLSRKENELDFLKNQLSKKQGVINAHEMKDHADIARLNIVVKK
jgi:hypothetical protein